MADSDILAPAFPVKVKRNVSSDPLATPVEMQFLGLTMRDHFAAKAMATLMIEDRDPDYYRNVAYRSYRMADEMLRERKK